jgi:hypothetical protein
MPLRVAVPFLRAVGCCVAAKGAAAEAAKESRKQKAEGKSRK